MRTTVIYYLLKFYNFFRSTSAIYVNFQVAPLRRSLRREISESRIVLSLRTDWMARVTSVFVRWFSLQKIRIEIYLQIQGLKLTKFWKTRRKIANKFCWKFSHGKILTLKVTGIFRVDLCVAEFEDQGTSTMAQHLRSLVLGKKYMSELQLCSSKWFKYFVKII